MDQNATEERAGPYRAAIVAACVLLAGINFGAGFAGDLDGHSLYTHAAHFARDGYRPSRSWGVPAYELIVYPLVAHVGLAAAKGYSLACYMLASLVLFALLRRLGTPARTAFLATGCFVVLPTSIISGNTLLETSQALLLALLATYAYVRSTAPCPGRWTWVSAAALGLATATRPDYLLFAVALATSALVFDRPGLRGIAACVGLWAIAAAAPFGLYPALAFDRHVFLPDPLARKLLHAAGGIVALLGVPAWILLSIWLVRARRRWRAGLSWIWHGRMGFLVATTTLLYLVRFVSMPDELEYVLVLVPLLVVALVKLGATPGRLGLLALALAIPNVVQVHFLDRDATGRVSTAIGFSPGTLVQDRRARLRLD